MKKSTLVPVVAPLVCVAVLALAGGAFAATLPQATPAASASDVASEPAVQPQVEPSLPDLLSDLLDPAAAVTEDAQAQSTLPCIAFSFCQACPDGTAQLCFVVQCGTQKTKRCGDCVPDCMTFDF